MTYETVATVSQITTLFLFIAMFLVALAYALWPSNQAKFDEVQRQALDLGSDRQSIGGR
jgi:cbb3-type cytochrome oxidase subunit 3